MPPKKKNQEKKIEQIEMKTCSKECEIQTDITITIGEHHFPTHKHTLMLYSKFLRTTIQQDEKCIILPLPLDTDVLSFTKFLSFIHDKHCKFTITSSPDDLIKFTVLCHFLESNVIDCEKLLLETINVHVLQFELFLSFLNLSKQLHLKKFEQALIKAATKRKNFQNEIDLYPHDFLKKIFKEYILPEKKLDGQFKIGQRVEMQFDSTDRLYRGTIHEIETYLVYINFDDCDRGMYTIKELREKQKNGTLKFID
jgi:hypothetical protein